MAEDTPCDDLKTRMQEITCAEKARMQDEGILSDEIAPELMQAALEANEIGDAILLQKLFGGHLIWDNSIEKWHLFNGQHWELDNQNQYLWLTEKCTRLYLDEAEKHKALKIEAESQSDKDTSNYHASMEKAYRKRCKEIRALGRTKRVWEYARSGVNGLSINAEKWDRYPMLLCCANGVIDLESGLLLQGRPEDYIRNASPIPYKGLDEPHPTWDEFLLNIIEDPDEIVFLQRFLGYCCTAVTKEDKIMFFQGRGRNGKTTLLEILKYVLGPLVGPIETEMLLEQRFARNADAPSPSLLNLQGKRLVWGSETSEGRRLNLDALKRLSSSETIKARAPHCKDPVEFRTTHKIILSTNHLPKAPAQADDYAVWKRIIVFPFRYSFVEDPHEDYEKKADKDLYSKLTQEASGILAWIVKGCTEWQQVGLQPPETIREITREYEKAGDLIGDFIEDCCEVIEPFSEKASALYESYRAWCERTGHKSASLSKFGEKMANRFRKEKQGCIYYRGIRLKDEWKE